MFKQKKHEIEKIFDGDCLNGFVRDSYAGRNVNEKLESEGYE